LLIKVRRTTTFYAASPADGVGDSIKPGA